MRPWMWVWIMVEVFAAGMVVGVVIERWYGLRIAQAVRRVFQRGA